MSVPAGFEVKGWCPGALRPMASGDGLIVRLRPRCGAVSLAELRGIAEAAGRFGNGHIDLTRRANLQIRGVGETTLGPLLDALRGLGLLEARPEAEALRNILVSPLSGVDPSEAMDMRPLASALADLLAGESWALPAKFAFVLDGGGRLPLSAERADLRLLATGTNGETLLAIGIASEGGVEWLGAVAAPQSERSGAKPVYGGGGSGSLRPASHDAGTGIEPSPQGFANVAAQTVLAVLRLMIASGGGGNAQGARGLSEQAVARVRFGIAAFLRPLGSPVRQRSAAERAPLGRLDKGGGPVILGLGAPFGGLEAAQLRALADAIAAEGGADIRLSPWRAFYIPLRDEVASERLMASARGLGFVTDAGDPLMRVQACPGRPACRAAHADTRADARRIASWMAVAGFAGTAHVSGCAKGCASSARAGLTLVGAPGGYRLMRDAAARDEGGMFIRAADIGEGVLHG
jgi:precorrin-3B synthase